MIATGFLLAISLSRMDVCSLLFEHFACPLKPAVGRLSDVNSEADRNVSLLIMAIHVNFVRSGDPMLGNIPWERYNSSHRAYLKVDPNPKMAESFNPRRMAFWNDYYPKLTQVRIESDKEVISGARRGVTIGIFLQISSPES